MKLLNKKKIIIIFFILIGTLVRLYYANNLPITNDEGAYLYDTLNIRNGQIPLVNFLTKSIPFIYLLTIPQLILGNSFFWGRVFIIVISAFTSYILYLLTTNLFNKKIGLIAGLTYWSFPLIAAYTTLIHTEPLQVLFVLLSYWLLFKTQKSKNQYLLIFSSLFMVLAFFTRQSSFALIFLPIVYDLIQKYVKHKKINETSILFTFFTLIIIILLTVLSYKYIGEVKTSELIGGVAVNLALNDKKVFSLGEIVIYPIKFLYEAILGSSNFFKDGLIISAFVVFALSYNYLSFLRERFKAFNFYSVLSAMIILCFVILQSKFSLNTPFWRINLIPQTNLLFLSMVLVLYTFSKTLSKKDNKNRIEVFPYLKNINFVTVWLLGVTIIYLLWIKFRTPYIIEFLPPLIIMFAIGLFIFYTSVSLIVNKIYSNNLKLALILFILFSCISSFFLNKNVYFTGLFSPSDINKISNFLTKDSEKEDLILTASVILPYMSGDRVVYDVSHPAWYGYNTIREDILVQYLPTFSKIVNSLEEKMVKYVIKDPFTNDSYFKRKELNDVFLKNYYLVKSIGRAEIYKVNEKTLLEK